MLFAWRSTKPKSFCGSCLASEPLNSYHTIPSHHLLWVSAVWNSGTTKSVYFEHWSLGRCVYTLLPGRAGSEHFPPVQYILQKVNVLQPLYEYRYGYSIALPILFDQS